jgi:hypothetical protein
MSTEHQSEIELSVDAVAEGALQAADDACAAGVIHLPGVTNPRLRLHQEFSMRTGGYDEVARLESGTRGHTTFHALVEELGLEAAIRDVKHCCWLSESDWRHAVKGAPCVECQEVAHA